MGGFYNVQPLLRIQFIGADSRPNIIVQYLGSRTRKGSESCLFKPGKERCNGHLEGGGALPNLERRKSMDVKAGRDLFNGTTDRYIRCSGIIWMNSTL